MKIFLIAGARPNFMKIAPIYREAPKNDGICCKLVHTGQHYDYEMSQAFFEDLEIPQPHFFLEAGSGSHAVQTARIMVAFEKICELEKPDIVIVVGDVNSTLACSIVAKKMQVKVAHIEAGLRSFDLSMPEEINRMVTDSITDFFFVTEKSAIQNLIREGKPESQIYFVGNVMIDNLYHQLKQLDNGFTSQYHSHKKGNFIFLTLHRPSNVDRKESLLEIAGALNRIAEKTPILFPVHPRTRNMLENHHIRLSSEICLLPPLNFKDSLFLWKDSAVVMTDSGGLQEETTALGVPCITLRENTERPITIEMGSNIMGGCSRESILKAYEEVVNGKKPEYRVPPKWDGRASERIWEVLSNLQF